MTIRIQPRDIVVPADDPFEHDLLGREESIEALTNVISSLDGPCVMAVDAGWGMGKTTFLKMWAQHLRNAQFPVVMFNAWETDFAQDPFIALYSEITGGLSELPGASRRIDAQRLRSAAGVVLRALPGAGLRVALSAVPHAGSQLVHEVSPRRPTPREEVAATYQETKTALRAFRARLCQIAKAIARENDNAPLVVMIDELDRCRPTYAIELLEAAKHLFSVDHIVFVVCLDRAQLAHSVKAVYGACFDAEGYLWRFFDIDYRLPQPDRKRFITAALESAGIPTHVESRAHGVPNAAINLHQLLIEFFDGAQFTLRRVQHAIHRFTVILASSPDGMNLNIVAVLLLLRTVEPGVYRRLIAGEATDKEVIDALFVHPESRAVHETERGAMVLGVLISCALLSMATTGDGVDAERLPVLSKYLIWREGAEISDRSYERAHHARMVVAWVNTLCGVGLSGQSAELLYPRDEAGFGDAVCRLELFSEDLTKDAYT